jgi:hypothetical protein
METCFIAMLGAVLMPAVIAAIWVLVLLVIVFFGPKIHPIFADRDIGPGQNS